MCLGVPGKVVDVLLDDGLLMGRVSFDGVVRKVCLEYVPEVQVGEYVLVHVGFALTRIDEQEALEVFKLLEQIPALDERRDDAFVEQGPHPAEFRERKEGLTS